MQKRGHIICLLQYFRINVVINELQKFFENSFDILDFLKVRIYQRHFCHKLLFLFLISFLEFKLDFLFFVFQFLCELIKSFIYVLHLLELQSTQFFFYLFYQFLIFLIKPMSVNQHFLQVKNILFQARCHFFNLYEIVTVVFIKHAPYANCKGALLAEVLNDLVKMLWTVDVVIGIHHFRLLLFQNSQYFVILYIF